MDTFSRHERNESYREFSCGALYYAVLIVFSFNSVDKIEIGSKSNLSS